MHALHIKKIASEKTWKFPKFAKPLPTVIKHIPLNDITKFKCQIWHILLKETFFHVGRSLIPGWKTWPSW